MNAIRAIGRTAREIARLTGQSFWRGFIGFYHSDNLTYAASIAYYALLSLFPFFLLAFALLGRADAATMQLLADITQQVVGAKNQELALGLLEQLRQVGQIQN